MTPARVLFICIGNSIRSQMAEAFARRYGSDVIEPSSAGLAPAMLVQPGTHQAMAAKNIRLDGAFPKALDQAKGPFDLVVNISGRELPDWFGPDAVETWDVPDPIGGTPRQYEAVCDDIERRVMRLILLRRAAVDGRT